MALEGSVARRYARALRDIGVAQGTYEQIGKDLEVFAKLVAGSAELSNALTNPIFPLSQRKSVLDQLSLRLGVLPAVRNFLMLVADRGRLSNLSDIARELAALVDEQAGRVRALLVSARPLPEDVTLTLRSAIEKRLGKRVILERREDPSLIGGLLAKVGDVLYDGSVRNQLEQAKEQLLS